MTSSPSIIIIIIHTRAFDRAKGANKTERQRRIDPRLPVPTGSPSLPRNATTKDRRNRRWPGTAASRVIGCDGNGTKSTSSRPRSHNDTGHCRSYRYLRRKSIKPSSVALRRTCHPHGIVRQGLSRPLPARKKHETCWMIHQHGEDELRVTAQTRVPFAVWELQRAHGAP